MYQVEWFKAGPLIWLKAPGGGFTPRREATRKANIAPPSVGTDMTRPDGHGATEADNA